MNLATTRVFWMLALGMALGGCTATGTTGTTATAANDTRQVDLTVVQDGDRDLDCDALEAQFYEVEAVRDQLDVAADQNRQAMAAADTLGQAAAAQMGAQLGMMGSMLGGLTSMAGAQTTVQNDAEYDRATKRMNRLNRLFTQSDCGRSLLRDADGRSRNADDDGVDQTTQIFTQAMRQAQGQSKGRGKGQGQSKGRGKGQGQGKQ